MSLRLHIVNDDASFRDLREAWDRILRASRDRSVFLTWHWAYHWWREFGRNDRLHIMVVSDGDEAVALAPFLRAPLRLGALGTTMLVGIGQENADYGGLLLGDRPREAGALILDALEADMERGGAVVNFTRLRPDGDLLPLIEARFGRAGSRVQLICEEQSEFPCLDLSAVEDPEQYVRRLDTRNDSRRCLRRMRESHEVTFEYDVAPTRESLGVLFELYGRRWQDKSGRASGVFASARGREFVCELAESLHRDGMVRLSFLSADGAPIAGRFGFEFEHAYLGYMETFEPEFARYGPGQILVAQILAEEVARGMHEFDFMRGEGLHKSKWANEARSVGYWVATGTGWKGQARRRLMWNLMRLRVRRSTR